VQPTTVRLPLPHLPPVLSLPLLVALLLPPLADLLPLLVALLLPPLADLLPLLADLQLLPQELLHLQLVVPPVLL
jgi:hypothetical protein